MRSTRRATRDPLAYQRIAWGGIRYRPRRRWTPGALREMLRNTLAQEGRVSWPWNLAEEGPGRWGPGGPADEDQVRAYLRMAGWARNLDDHRCAFHLLRRSQDANGYNSPHTTIDMWELIRHWRSPGQLGRWLAKVIRRGDRILAPWGLAVAWEALEFGLLEGGHRGPRRPHKAGVIAAACTLAWAFSGEPPDVDNAWGPERLWTYRGAREYLAAHPLRSPGRWSPGEITMAPGRSTGLSRTDTRVAVVDPTTREVHSIGVPPVFGLAARRRPHDLSLVHGAVAWTFGLAPGDYRPELQT